MSASKEHWRCPQCGITALHPCRTAGHRSEQLILVKGTLKPRVPRRIFEAVGIANGVALVLVGDA